MPKQVKKELNNLLIEQFRVTDNLFKRFSDTSRDLEIIYNIILVASVLLLVSTFQIKIKSK
jgi:hypothetical protein